MGIVWAVSQAPSVPLLFPLAHRGLSAWIPCDNLNFSVHRFRSDMSAVTLSGYRIPEYTPAQVEYYRRNALENPAARHYRETGCGDAIRMSDLLPVGQWVASRFWQATLADLGFRYSMNAIWRLNNNSAFVFNLNRRERDFSTADRHRLNLVYPFIGARYQQLGRAAPPRPAAAGRRSGGVAANKPYQPLEEVRPQGLTARESEVFKWIGGGKTNAEIAIILGISIRTVQKHVENILRKLGLENRYAIAAAAASFIDEA